MSLLRDEDEQRVRAALAADRKIEAIKIYREATGLGLKEAKEAVEAMAAGRAPSHPAPSSQSVDEGMDQVMNALAAGNKIEAIKIYREMTGVGLKEAKEAVEDLQRGGAVPRSSSQPPSGHGAVKSSSGCLWILAAGLGAVLATVML